ncbi:hypothetical protein KEM56_004543, partial [Ascosphaera pollenicola]
GPVVWAGIEADWNGWGVDSDDMKDLGALAMTINLKSTPEKFYSVFSKVTTTLSADVILLPSTGEASPTMTHQSSTLCQVSIDEDLEYGISRTSEGRLERHPSSRACQPENQQDSKQILLQGKRSDVNSAEDLIKKRMKKHIAQLSLLQNSVEKCQQE